ncbi:MAG TPA: hypothetical protein PK029_04455 [Bacteroidales bacterium]|nr:hypothetical protein [Bacteroidales bacterium]
MNLNISSYCVIRNNTCSVNGEPMFQADVNMSSYDFLTALYRNSQIQYPKFFKMDTLSKLGFLASEFVLKNTELHGDTPNYSTVQIFANSASSLQTDCEYQQTIGAEYFPSPSVFVYTLPNIVMGEIAIKHKLYGENTFFVQKSFDNSAFFQYIYQVFLQDSVTYALVGWIDYYKHTCEACVMLVEKTNEVCSLPFTKKNSLHLYNL